MRVLLPLICGFLIGIAVSAAYRSARQDPQARPHPETTASSPGDRGSPGGLPRPVSALQVTSPARAAPAFLEENNPAAPVSRAEESDLPAPESLLALLQAGSGTLLAQEIERLLCAGPAGFPVLVEFLREGLKPSGVSAFQEGRLSFSLLRVAVLDQERVARFAEYLLPLLAEEEDLELRQQVLRFLPPFLAASGERFPRLSAAFQQMLLADVQRGGEQIDLWRILEAMETMGLKPPVEPLQAILSDPKREKLHSLIIQRLGKRNDVAGLDALAAHVESFPDFNHRSVKESLQAISLMQLPEAQDLFQGYLSSSSAEMRAAATLAYFSSARDAGSLPLAIRFLNSDGDLALKQSLLEKLQQIHRPLFEALERDPGVLSDKRLQLHLPR